MLWKRYTTNLRNSLINLNLAKIEEFYNDTVTQEDPYDQMKEEEEKLMIWAVRIQI
jgi:hypothetical protein